MAESLLQKPREQAGVIITYVLVFGGIFLILLSGLLGFILLQLRQAGQKVAWQESFEIAEAGIDYYLWCLNHGLTDQCQGEKNYFDLEGKSLGKFSLAVTSQSSCGTTVQGQAESVGWTNEFPQTKRKIRVFSGQPSLARYAYVLNDNVWIGADHQIRGPYHSNGGVRFDGQNQSLVTSAKTDWICTASFGCGPAGLPGGGLGLGRCPDQCQIVNQTCVCPGVFTTTQNSSPDLFSFPATSFNFDGITIGLAQMKQSSLSGGIYLPPSNTINLQGKGYHLKFKSNGQVEVWIVTSLSSTRAYSLEENWHYDYFTIGAEYLYQTSSIPSSCSVIFVEDDLWPEGVVKGKVTVASADLIHANTDTDIVLPGNLDYASLEGSNGLTMVAERNILIGPQSPDQMTLRGIFLAQKGRFSRNHYPNNLRDKLEIVGTIASNGRVGTQWTSGSNIVSGYVNRETVIDTNLLYLAPPLTPVIDSQYETADWEEIKAH